MVRRLVAVPRGLAPRDAALLANFEATFARQRVLAARVNSLATSRCSR